MGLLHQSAMSALALALAVGKIYFVQLFDGFKIFLKDPLMPEMFLFVLYVISSLKA